MFSTKQKPHGRQQQRQQSQRRKQQPLKTKNFSCRRSFSSRPALSRADIQHIKDLRNVSDRNAQRQFLVEGRKLIETISLSNTHKGTVNTPNTVYITSDVYDQMNTLLTRVSAQQQSNTASLLNSSLPNQPIINNQSSSSHISSSLHSLSNNFITTSFLSQTKQFNWDFQPTTGKLIVGKTHGHSQESSDINDLVHNPQLVSFLRMIISRSVILESKLMQRLSTFSTAPGILAQFPFLPNVMSIKQYDNEHNDDDDDCLRCLHSACSDIFQDILSKSQFKPVHSQISASSLATHLSTAVVKIFSPSKQQQNAMSRSEFWTALSLAHPSIVEKYGNIQPPSFHKQVSVQPTSFSSWNWSQGGLVLYGLSDPGNIGTLIRSADAFGVKQIVLVDCCDIYNEKIIASTGGALANPNILTTSSQAFLNLFVPMQRQSRGMAMESACLDLTPPLQSLSPFHALMFDAGKQFANDRATTSDDIPILLHDWLAAWNTIVGNEAYFIGLTPTRGQSLESIPFSLQQHYQDIVTQATSRENSPISDKDMTSLQSQLTFINRSPNALPWLVVGSEAFGFPLQVEKGMLHRAFTIELSDESNVGSLNAAIAGTLATFLFSQRPAGGNSKI